MQTFLTNRDPCVTAESLDTKRLGKQRLEAIQILRILLGKVDSKAWRNHPAVRMWKGYEPYLLKRYLRAILDEWVKRGYKNMKCEEHYNELLLIVKDMKPEEPSWFSDQLFISHQSNLVRKLPGYYRQLFDVPDNIPYLWPV
jgi:hypothetical protein